MIFRRVMPFAAALAAVALASPISAQGEMSAAERILAQEGYTQPSQAIIDAVLAPRWENISLSNLDPTGSWFIHSVSDGPPSLAIFAKPQLNLGALQIDPIANRSRRLTTRSDVGYQLVSAQDGRRVDINVPAGARVSGATWSPDGSQIAFMAHFEDGTHIYVADASDGDSRQLTRDYIQPVHVTSVAWTADGNEIITVVPPQNRGAMPAEPTVPQSPMVRHTTEDENRLRTYFDLLENPYEKELVRYFSTSQMAAIDVDSRQVTRIGEPTMITGIDVSPDGQHFRVDRLAGDFSYIVPTMSSASLEELWDRQGNVLAVLEENEAREGVQDGGNGGNGNGGDDRRGLTWHPMGGGLVFAQMTPRPEGDDADDTADAADEPEEDDEDADPRMDRIVHWVAPFGDDDISVIYQTEDRVGQFAFNEGASLLFLTRGGRDNQTVHAIDLANPAEEHLLARRRGSNITRDPGSLDYMTGSMGERVVRTTSDNAHAFLEGTQYFENPEQDAPRPFVDRVNVMTGDKERIFQSSPDIYETVRTAIDRDMNELIVMRESSTMVPQGYRVSMAGGAERQLTQNVDYTPAVTNARRVSAMVERSDGFVSKVSVTMPVGWREGQPAPPAMFWFYPSEYTDQDNYNERSLARFNKNDFPNMGVRSMDMLSLLGYAVVDPDLPIVGDADAPNDNYLPDLRNTLAAIIDTLDSRGWADRAKLGIGGHSYGAFGTANAMVNTPFFKAGIAGDGNYNRSLTPAGFQREPRQLWEAEQIYIEMSPFFVADRMSGSLLMYHGMDDHNVGTNPEHSKRLFHALNVLGKDAALYMYPYEDHGPATRETVLDLWARWSAWLEVHVMGPDTRIIS